MIKRIAQNLIMAVLAAVFILTARFTVYAVSATKITAPIGSTVVLDGQLDLFYESSSTYNCNNSLRVRVCTGPTYACSEINNTMDDGWFSSCGIHVQSLGGQASTRAFSCNLGLGAHDYVRYIYGASNMTFSHLSAISDYAYGYWSIFDMIIDDESQSSTYWGYAALDNMVVSTDYSIRLDGIKSSASERSIVCGQATNDNNHATYSIPDHYAFTAVSSTNPDGTANTSGIFPQKYDDLVYPSKMDLQAVIPWYTQYSVANGEVQKMDYKTAKNISAIYPYSSYQWTYYNEDYVNSYIHRNVGDYTFMKGHTFGSFGAIYTIMRPNDTYNIWLTGTLSDNIDTVVPYGAYVYPKLYEYTYSTNTKDTDKSVTYNVSEIFETETLRSTWQISKDNKNWVTVLSNSADQSFQFNCITHYVKIGSSMINTDAILGENNIFYIRRIGNYSGIMGNSVSGYQNVVSPSMRVRVPIALEKVEAKYIGKGVVSGGYVNTKDIQIDAYYTTDPDVPVVMSGDGSYVEYDNLKILSVGDENYIRFRFTCPLTGTVKEGYFTVRGLDVTPVAMTAQYVTENEDNNAVQKLAYDASLVRINVKFNNGTTSVIYGDSPYVGLYAEKFWKKGDLDKNGVINFKDYNRLLEAVAGYTLTDYEKEQADLNGDGVIDTNDLSRYTLITDRTVKSIGDNLYYAAYSGLNDATNESKPYFTQFRVNGVERKPYSISIKEEPLKVNYIENETFDPTGLIVDIYYDNKDYETISFTRFTEYNGITFGDADHPADKMSAADKVMPISYTENGVTVTTDLLVNVQPKTLSSISISSPPDRTTYYSGENFDVTGLVVKAHFNTDDEGNSLQTAELSGSELELSSNKNMVDSRDYVVIKTKSANSMGGYERIKKGLFVSGQTFEIGDTGTWQRTNGNYVSGEVVGNYIVTISYTYNSVTAYAYQPIEVLGKKLASVDVISMPYKTEFVAGTNFNSTGLVLRANYTDGSVAYVYEKTESQDGYEVINGTSLTTDINTIIVSYTDSDITAYAEIPITVIDPSITGITVQYTGTKVSKGSDFDLADLLVIVNYDDGSMNSFRADSLNEDGTMRVRILPTTDINNVPEDGETSMTIDHLGYNYFTVWYGGFYDIFMVEGVEDASHVDYSSYVGESRRKISTWTEQFTATKIRTVADYINERVNEEGDLADVTTQTTTDDRSSLLYTDGTAKNAGGTSGKSSALFSFLREGKWRPSATSLSVEYKARTAGFLFPEVTNPDFAIANEKDIKYIEKYGQNRSSVLASDDGWGDWVSQGDSAGTVLASRTAYNYSAANKDTSSYKMFMDRMKVRLKGVPEGESAYLQISVEDIYGSVKTENVQAEEKLFSNPSRMSICLGGQISVEYADGSSGLENFADVYKVYYRATTDNEAEWQTGGSWTGVAGVLMEDFEILIMLQETSFDPGALSAAPYIAQQPQSVSVLSGNQAVFSVIAVGNDLAYQWYKNGTAIDGAVESVYRTADLYLEDSGDVYRCRVYNASGETDSNEAKVTVNDVKPTFTTDLTDDIIVNSTSPATYTLTVEATSYVPENITYQWQYKESVTDEWKPLAGESGNTLELNVNGMLGKYIRCVATNTAGSAMSNYIRVLSETSATAEITCDTQYISQSNSESVRFAATAEGLTGEPTYTWYLDEVRKNLTGNVLSYIPTVVGNHSVKVEISCSSGETITKKLNFYVNPSLTATITAVVNKPEKKVVLTAVIPDTTVAYDIQWIIDGQLISVSDESYTLSADKKVLTCNKFNHGGQYSVQLTVKDSKTKYLYAYDRYDINNLDFTEE